MRVTVRLNLFKSEHLFWVKSKLKICIWDNIQKGQCNHHILPCASSLSSCEVWECTDTLKAGAWEVLQLRQASSWLHVQLGRGKILPLGNASVSNSTILIQTLKRNSSYDQPGPALQQIGKKTIVIAQIHIHWLWLQDCHNHPMTKEETKVSLLSGSRKEAEPREKSRLLRIIFRIPP